MKKPSGWLNAAIFAATALVPCSAEAQSAATSASTYPTKPVRVVVGLSPGGGTDIQARMLSQKLTENLGNRLSSKTVPAREGS